MTYATPGIYPVVLTATNAAGSDSVKTLRVQVKPTLAEPTATEPFNTAPVPDYWEIVNPDKSTTWISFSAIGPDGRDGSSVGVNGYDYAAVGQCDQLLSVPVALPASLPRATLRFAVAYAPQPGSTDSLLVRVLTRCAPHQVLGTVYRKGGHAAGHCSAHRGLFLSGRCPGVAHRAGGFVGLPGAGRGAGF